MVKSISVPNTTAELRQAFIDYFVQRDHTLVPSSPLVPANDPTLLFTNAGMVQFKDVFLQFETRPYQRAVSSQRCVRAGGKHNDLENVGYTARHHTFFEMLGNFSFGDYFKQEAIRYAWDFLTNVLHLPPEKLWVTVYIDDDEAADIWLNDIKVDPNRLSRCGENDNFWQMGDVGPCGPCTEIFYDHGPDVPGGPPGSPEQDGDRYIEIWNLVFMQFNRDENGEFTSLPQPCVDTGMGLERLAAVMQSVHSNYDIDLFQSLLCAAAKLASTKDLHNTSLRVIADHIRSCAFLIVDGVVPSNEGRGYVLRRIIRRAIRHANKLGIKEAFFYRLVEPLVNEMGDAFPELSQSQAIVEKILRTEEEQFAKTLEQGLHILEGSIAHLGGKLIPGEVVFKLYDTYGFPADLTGDIARERGLTIDMNGFDQAMAKQRELSQEASQFSAIKNQRLDVFSDTVFTGYETLTTDTQVIDLLHKNKNTNILRNGDEGAIILAETPFYPESGGQVGDTGSIIWDDGAFTVLDTQKQNKTFIHYGKVTQGNLTINQAVTAQVDAFKRAATRLNHSATHLLHAALRCVLGAHVIQKGSLVNSERLRFDFAHYEALSQEQLHAIEDRVNAEVRANLEIETHIMDQEEAKKSGAMALFGEKYDQKVRVLKMGQFSTELCGGTHAKRTGDIGLLKITSESGIAAGIRRIEGITGAQAIRWFHDTEVLLEKIEQKLKSKREDIEGKLQLLIEKNKEQDKKIEQLQNKLASNVGDELAEKTIKINGIKCLVQILPNSNTKILRDTLDQLKSKLETAVIVLATVDNDRKVTLLAGVTKNLTDKIQAGDLINHVAKQIGGKGGGRPDMAQAGGTLPENLPTALASVEEYLLQISKKDALL